MNGLGRSYRTQGDRKIRDLPPLPPCHCSAVETPAGSRVFPTPPLPGRHQRESIRKLSGTGGRESDRECGGVTHIWKPCFQMRVKDLQTGQLGGVRLVEGDRTEMTV